MAPQISHEKGQNIGFCVEIIDRSQTREAQSKALNSKESLDNSSNEQFPYAL
jgi:hypothetical protein